MHYRPHPSTGVRLKHKRESQDDVAHFSTWPDMGLALSYAKEELAPREKTEGAKWRIIKREDGREDKSRDKQWRCYRSVVIAVGALMRGNFPGFGSYQIGAKNACSV